MALVQQQTAVSSKQIVLDASAADGTVLYKVPAGMTCAGVFSARGPSARVTINGVTVGIGGYSTGGPGALHVTLLGGTVVKATGSDAAFVGVEQ